MKENNIQEMLFVLHILEASRNYKKLPKFVNDILEMYMDSTGQDYQEAIDTLKEKIKQSI